MALSNGRGNTADGNLIVLKPKHQDADKKPVKPHFEVRGKDETGEWVDMGQYDRFSGNLKRIVPKVKEYKKDGKVIDAKDIVGIFLEDGEDTYMLELTYKISTRNLFNRFLNLETFENLEISYWRDDKGYDVMTLRQNDQVVKAKYYKKNEFTKEGEELLPETRKVKVNKVEVTDSTELDEFFKAKLEELNSKVAGHKVYEAPAVKAAEPVKTAKPAAKKKVVEEEDEEAPF